ncbi:MAG: type 1 glutamine amidotransferase [Bdellovibrionaceae bacterium]|nr:type 1 glutamine amidotransferase [Pseudobdellovibrionaceae bacterium]
MRKILVFQHVGHEPLGTLDPLLKAAGFRIRYINFGRDPFLEPNVDAYNGLIILGGPMGVYEANQHPHLLWEMKQIEKAFTKNIPVLGICLGSQLMAAVLGAHVRKAPRWELGWNEIHTTEHAKNDPVFKHYKQTEKIFQIHQDTFDVPSTAVHLASSDLCSGQAFRYGNKAYALQYHLEVNEPMIHRWMKRPENNDIVLQSHGAFNIETIDKDTSTHISASLALSQKTFQSFIDLFQLPERPLRLGSR